MAGGDVTVLLERLRGGDADAAGPLFELLYPELKAIAGKIFRSQPVPNPFRRNSPGARRIGCRSGKRSWRSISSVIRGPSRRILAFWGRRPRKTLP